MRRWVALLLIGLFLGGPSYAGPISAYPTAVAANADKVIGTQASSGVTSQFTAQSIAALATSVGVALPHAANNTALNALPHTAYGGLVIRDGFANPGDAPQQVYVASGSACPAVDGGIQVATSDGGCWLMVVPAKIDVREYGVTTAATDNTSALNAAMAGVKALTTSGAILSFPAGGFAVTGSPALTLPNALFTLGIECAGPDATTLNFSGSNGLALTYSSFLNGARIAGCTFTTNKAGGGKGLAIVQNATSVSPAYGAQTTLDHDVFRGVDGPVPATDYWTTAIDLAEVSNVAVVGGTVIYASAGQQGNGIHFAGSSGQLAVVLNLTDMSCMGGNACVFVDTYAQGVTAKAVNATGDNYGIYVPTGTGVAQVAVEASQVNAMIDGILVNGVADFNVVGSTFYPLANNAVEILIQNEAGCQIGHNTFDFSGAFTGTVGVEVASEITSPYSKPCAIYPNTYRGLGIGNWVPNAGAFATSFGPVGANVYMGITTTNTGAGATTHVLVDQPESFVNLPTCAAAYQGRTAFVVDATTNTWGANVTAGSGSDPVLVECNATNWTVIGK